MPPTRRKRGVLSNAPATTQQRQKKIVTKTQRSRLIENRVRLID